MRLTSEERATLNGIAAEYANGNRNLDTYVESLLAKREALVQAATLEMAAKQASRTGCNICAGLIRRLAPADCLAELRKQWEAEQDSRRVVEGHHQTPAKR